MADLNRRDVLLSAAAVLALAGCTPRGSQQTSATSGAPAATTRTATATAKKASADWSALAKTLDGTLFRPGDPGYGKARQVQNPRFDDAKPKAVLQAASVDDVRAGLAFARDTGVPVALRSGGHNYAGWSAGGARGTDVPPSLVISTARLDGIRMKGASAVLGPGAPLARVYETLGRQGRAIGSGSCGTVAIEGITLGGGIGVLSRSFGLTCDQLTSVDPVTADGELHHASAKKDPDLFWACRGGGGGAVGVVTSLTFDTRKAPGVSMFSYRFPWSAAADVVAAWQSWAPRADARLWSTLKLLGGSKHPSGPVVRLSGTWTGPEAEAARQLASFLDDVGQAPSSHSIRRRSYTEAMLRYAGCTSAAECTTGSGGVLEREPESAASSIGAQKLSSKEIDRLVARVEAARKVKGLKEGGVSLDALGGAISDLREDETAFPFRKALLTAQYTATYAEGADPAPFDAYVRKSRSVMSSAWGSSAYVNYPDPSLSSPGRDYFGDNEKRLASIKKRYDPDGLFAQPHFL